jgi:uncharacterized membrane protein YphA (DoxX/SURF4 family)
MNNFVLILTWIIRIAVGVLFIFSGFVKANDITGFAYKLDEYWIVFDMQSLKSFSFFLSWFFSVFEISLGIALILGYKIRLTSWILLGMILFFTFLTWYSWYYSAVQDCGCFGDAIKLTPYQSFMKDLVLLVLVTFIFIRRKHIPPFPSAGISAAVSLSSFALFGVFSWYCYRHLPAIDFISAYKVGANIPENMTLFDAEDIPVVHDFSEFCGSCYVDSTKGHLRTDGFKGATLYIVIYNPQAARESDVKAAADFATEMKAKAPEIKLCGGTNVPDSLVKYNLPFVISGQDEKTLKTMVRSSPGYILLKDGIVVNKWSRIDVPTPAEVQELLK